MLRATQSMLMQTSAMKWLFDNLSSTEWWLSVVIVGIAVNLLSTVIQKTIGRLRARISTRYQESKSRDAERQRDLVTRLKSDKDELAAFRARMIMRKIDVTEYMLTGVFFLLLGLQLGGSKELIFKVISSVSFLTGNVVWLIGLKLGIRSMRDRDVVYKVERRDE